MKNRKSYTIGMVIIVMLVAVVVVTHKEKNDDYAKLYAELIIETLDESTGGNYEVALERAKNVKQEEDRTIALDFTDVGILNKKEKSRVIELLKPVWKCNIITTTYFELNGNGKINEEGVYEEGSFFILKDGEKVWNQFEFEIESSATGQGGYFMKHYQVKKVNGKWKHKIKIQGVE